MLDSNRAIKGSEDLIFSLDIGTRTVIGILGQYKNDKFKILESSIVEHGKRNMYDGQIHDIEGVTETVKKVKEELEKKTGLNLKKVSIAAAGRALETNRMRIDKKIDPTMEINKSMIESLELEAVQMAEKALDIDINKSNLKYYCIGYSVVNYYLDNSFIEKLEGHKGENIGVDILATFLPQVVIDSLYSVVNRVGLQVSNITLEPIAAINIAIKENLRLLNLALVDVGAGTSDIAITKDGTVIAYAMTSIAGDELTESLSKKFLLDFDTSERLKINLNKEEEHEFQDIVGIKHSMSTNEIVSSIEDTINHLAKEISEKIIKYNGKAPSAVFLIGGSSQIPRLDEHLANYLGLPRERVAIKDISSIENIVELSDDMKGPDMVTPIGIAMEGVNKKYKNYIEIYVNGEILKVFKAKSIKVSDILIQINYDPRCLLAGRGDDFLYHLNGEEKLIKGELGKPAEIYVNGKQGNLNTVLNDRDYLEIRQGEKGKMKTPYLYDCIPLERVAILDNREINLIKNIRVNGHEAKDNVEISEGYKIDYDEIRTVQDLVEDMGIDTKLYTIFRDGQDLSLDAIINNNDVLSIKPNNDKKINLTINQKEKTIYYNKDKLVFVDLFNYFDFDLTKPKGKLILKLNGREAKYMESLKDGDKVEIFWHN